MKTGATPAVINHCLNVADEYDVRVAIHTDTLNEGGCVLKIPLQQSVEERFILIIQKSAGSGHAPDIIRAAAAQMYCHPQQTRRCLIL